MVVLWSSCVGGWGWGCWASLIPSFVGRSKGILALDLQTSLSSLLDTVAGSLVLQGLLKGANKVRVGVVGIPEAGESAGMRRGTEQGFLEALSLGCLAGSKP